MIFATRAPSSGPPAGYRQRVDRPFRLSGLGVDVLMALTLAAVMSAEAWVSPTTDVDAATIGVLLVAVAPLLVRRWSPGAALVGCLLAIVLVETTTDIFQTIALPSMFAGYYIARSVEWRRAVGLGVLLMPIVLVNLAFVSDFPMWHFDTLKNMSFVALPLVVGVAVRSRRELLASLVERAEIAEATREEEARRRVDEERLRIARDLHDLVAHALVAINVQAGVAAHVGDLDPETNRRTFRDIKQVSGEALADLRDTLGILRTETEEAPVAPTARLADLADLRPRLEAAGVHLELDLDPGSGGLPAATDSIGYRIAQEALTNVMRHAAPTTARVVVRREEQAVLVVIEDDGPFEEREREPGSGNGIRGMIERAQAVGGSMEVGPGAERGWRVEGRLPLTMPGDQTADQDCPCPLPTHLFCRPVTAGRAVGPVVGRVTGPVAGPVAEAVPGDGR